ncbi:MAG: hypothetical protein JW967_09300 [Dehalococcoidales bacterium]|nr:hypothetical protein [Dehalococcoidales bacterium]
MEAILDNKKDQVRTTLLKTTKRELFLIEWSLDIMAQSSSQTGVLRREIDTLRKKIAMAQVL